MLALVIGGQWYRSRQPGEAARQQPAGEQEPTGTKTQQPIKEARQATQGEPEGKGAKERGQQEEVAKLPLQDQQPQQEAKGEPPERAAEVQRKAEERKKTEATQRVAALLERANKQKTAKRLTTPAGDNALETYQEVLRIAPGHEEALAGVKEIKEQYRQSAEVAQQKGDWAKAQAHYETALKIEPQDETLNTALQQVKEAQKGAKALAGWYETTAATPVLKEPRQDATVLTKLSPQKRVHVAGAVGDYVRIESARGNPPGYIARKDVTPAPKEMNSTEEKQQAALEKVSPVPEVVKKFGSLIKYDNGTVLDTRTGLMWMAKDFHTIEGRAPRNWNEATEWASKMNRENYGGHSDWRVPTVAEYDAVAHLFSNSQVFEQSIRSKGQYWSSDVAKTIFGSGPLGVGSSGQIGFLMTGSVDNVRLVRSGQLKSEPAISTSSSSRPSSIKIQFVNETPWYMVVCLDEIRPCAGIKSRGAYSREFGISPGPHRLFARIYPSGPSGGSVMPFKEPFERTVPIEPDGIIRFTESDF